VLGGVERKGHPTGTSPPPKGVLSGGLGAPRAGAVSFDSKAGSSTDVVLFVMASRAN
jgi:hypothetical protein